MPSLLRNDDHYVLRKLCNELLPWMIGGGRARHRWFVYLAATYGYGGEIATLLAGLGIGAPIVSAFGGKVEPGRNVFDVLHEGLGPWFALGVVALGVWLVLRLVVGRQEAVARALFAKDCAKTMQKLYADLYTALADPNPMPKLAPIQEKVMRKVEEAIDKSVWPWEPPPPPPEIIALELEQQISDIRTKFMSRWTPPPPGAVM